MEFSHRKMLVSSFPLEKSFNLTIPCFQTYPPPTPPLTPTQTEDALSLLFTTVICILGSISLFLVLVVLVYLHIKRRNSSVEASPRGETNRIQDEEETEERDHHVWRINTSGLQRSVIDSITVTVFKKGDGTIDDTECSVCLNEFQEDESLRLLPKCSHAFHIKCIDTWLVSHKNCPLCRAPFLLLTKPLQQETNSRLNHGEEESSGARNVNVVLSRAHSDLPSVEKNLRRSLSIGGSSTLKCDGSDDTVANTSTRHLYSSFSAKFFSSSTRSRNQDQV